MCFHKCFLLTDLCMLSSAFHLSYNMLLNQIRCEEGNPENLLRNSFYQFQADHAIPDLEVSLHWYVPVIVWSLVFLFVSRRSKLILIILLTFRSYQSWFIFLFFPGWILIGSLVIDYNFHNSIFCWMTNYFLQIGSIFRLVISLCWECKWWIYMQCAHLIIWFSYIWIW